MSLLGDQLNPALEKLGENEKAIVTAALYGLERIVEGGIELAATKIKDATDYFFAELDKRISVRIGPK